MNRLEDKILQYIISGKVTEDHAIDKEIREDPSFDQTDIDLLNRIWSGADDLKDYQRAPHDTAWQNILKETGIKPNVRRINQTGLWMVAASFIGLITLGLYFLLQDPYITYQAMANQEYTLPDNSTIALQEGARIRYLKPDDFAKAVTREVYLEGQGVFEVIADASRPFKVITSLTSVDVLGTVFRYRTEGIFSESENLEGQVRFATNDGQNEVVLNPGDKASFDGTSMDVERYEPPPPPPQPLVIPTNNISIADLIDILGYQYPVVLEFLPSVQYSNVVVKVDLSVNNLDTMINNLVKDPAIQIEAIKTSSGYRISSLAAEPSGLVPDYTFDMMVTGVKPNE
ncbi:MAG: FecR domain-containing protein [Saprospiraceae bacterium]|nr:FecR domain-containing protein [Saprospiraceae bacterium]